MLEIIWILVEPRTPENVGAAARALKTMGFHQLRLVNPCAYREGPAQWLAHGSTDILDAVQVFDTLSDAITDCDFNIGSTAKARHGRHTALTPKELRSNVDTKSGTVQKIAMIFGREDCGLSNEELSLCDLVTTVPLAASYPSINLAQAVMIYAYEFAELKSAERVTSEISDGEYRAALERVEAFCERSGVNDEKLRHWWQERLPLLTGRDIRLLHQLLNDLAVGHPKQ